MLSRLHVDVLLKQVHTGLINDASQIQLQRLTEARAILESLGTLNALVPADRLRLARVDYYCGRAYYYSAQPREAVRHYQRVLPVAKEFGDQELMIMPSYVIGMALTTQGQFGKGLELLGQAVEPITQYLGASQDTVRCIIFHCITLAATGRGHQVQAGLERAQEWAKRLDHLVYQANFLLMSASTCMVMADWPKTIQLAERLLELVKRTGEALFVYCGLDLMAWSQSCLGQHQQALENRARAAEMRKSVGGGLLVDWFEATDGEIQLNSGRTEAALRQAKKVEASSREAGLAYSQAVAERVWACALSRLGGDMKEVEAHFRTALEICQGTEQIMNASQVELWWGRICRERNDGPGAQQHFAAALQALEAGGYEYALEDARRIAKGD